MTLYSNAKPLTFLLSLPWRDAPSGHDKRQDVVRGRDQISPRDPDAHVGLAVGRLATEEELVDLGRLDPDQVHTPGIYVNAILEGASYEKRIERRTIRKA